MATFHKRKELIAYVDESHVRRPLSSFFIPLSSKLKIEP